MHGRRMRPRPRQRPGRSRRTAGSVGVARRAASTIGASGFNAASRWTRSSGMGAMSVLVRSKRSATAACAVGLGIAVERRRAEHDIDRRHDAVEPQRGLEEGVGGERVEHGRRIGQAAGLERDAPERRPAGGLRARAAAGRTTSARPWRTAQQVQPLGSSTTSSTAASSSMMIERDGAELADQDGGVRQVRDGEDAGEERGLAAAQEAGQHRERDRLRRDLRQGGKAAIHVSDYRIEWRPRTGWSAGARLMPSRPRVRRGPWACSASRRGGRRARGTAARRPAGPFRPAPSP